ncbi:MAG: bifunctional DNA-formamidopyrimidine glycosylase/DNA-(apurinic or apyrimidinic site) lyase [Pseudomonadota bacterium]
MPELPEVETVLRGLTPVLVGRRFSKVEQRRADLRFPLPANFAERLEGRRVQAMRRRAKYLLAELDDDETLIAHLGMSGRFTVDETAGGPSARPGRFHNSAAHGERHTHIVFHMEEGGRVAYSDPRRFGYMDLIPTGALPGHKYFQHLGPEPLGDAFTPAYLTAVFKGRASPIKTTLLDQRVVVGVGNIYACEALHRAGISPRRRAGSVGPTRAERLWAAVRAVLAEAIEAGGSSLRDHAATDGELGYFQHQFQVYDREGEPCLRGPGVVRRIVQGGRSTFFCSECQR